MSTILLCRQSGGPVDTIYCFVGAVAGARVCSIRDQFKDTIVVAHKLLPPLESKEGESKIFEGEAFSTQLEAKPEPEPESEQESDPEPDQPTGKQAEGKRAAAESQHVVWETKTAEQAAKRFVETCMPNSKTSRPFRSAELDGDTWRLGWNELEKIALLKGRHALSDDDQMILYNNFKGIRHESTHEGESIKRTVKELNCDAVKRLLVLDEEELFTRARQLRPELQLHETIGVAVQKHIDSVEQRRRKTANDPCEGAYIATVEMGELETDVRGKLLQRGKPVVAGSHCVVGRSVDDHGDPIILRARARFSHLLISERADFDQISLNKAFQIVYDLRNLRHVPFQEVHSGSVPRLPRTTKGQASDDSVYEEQVCSFCTGHSSAAVVKANVSSA